MIENKCVIYKIINPIDGNIYIGSSINFEKRKRDHFSLLKKNRHPNYKLQDDYNNGIIFNIEILEYVDKDKILEIEQSYIDNLNPYYNIAKKTLAPMTGRKHSDELKKRWSDERKGENNVMYGKRHTDESKYKASKNRRGKGVRNKPNQKWFRGKKVDQSTKEKLRQSCRKTRVRCIDTGEIFDVMNDAAKKLGIRQGHISEVCRGVRAKAGGYSFEYVDSDNLVKKGSERIVYLYDMCYNLIGIFDSCKQVSKYLNCTEKSVSSCALRNMYSCKQHICSYAEITMENDPYDSKLDYSTAE